MIETILSKLNAIPSDKVMHFASGVVLFALVNLFDPYVALLTVAFTAIAKELYDQRNKEHHTPDPYDALATMLGGLVGLVITLTPRL